MLYKSIEELEPGDRIHTVYKPESTGIILLTPNYKLDESNINSVRRRFNDLGIDNVWVYNPALAVLEKYFSEELDEGKRNFYSNIRNNFMAVDKNIRLNKGFSIKEQAESIEELISGLEQAVYRNAFMEPSLRFDKSENWQRLASERCYTSLVLGLEMKGVLLADLKEKVREYGGEINSINYMSLGLGALFLDVGETFLPDHAKNVMDCLEG